GHDTPLSTAPVAPVGFGLVTIDQLVPSQCSTNVFSTNEESVYSPTASQLDVLGHDTPLRTGDVAPLGLGLVTIDQLVPFQRSTNVLFAELVEYSPTASQLVVLGHDTPVRTGPVAPVAVGRATTEQLDP